MLQGKKIYEYLAIVSIFLILPYTSSNFFIEQPWPVDKYLGTVDLYHSSRSND